MTPFLTFFRLGATGGIKWAVLGAPQARAEVDADAKVEDDAKAPLGSRAQVARAPAAAERFVSVASAGGIGQLQRDSRLTPYSPTLKAGTDSKRFHDYAEEVIRRVVGGLMAETVDPSVPVLLGGDGAASTPSEHFVADSKAGFGGVSPSDHPGLLAAFAAYAQSAVALKEHFVLVSSEGSAYSLTLSDGPALGAPAEDADATPVPTLSLFQAMRDLSRRRDRAAASAHTVGPSGPFVRLPPLRANGGLSVQGGGCADAAIVGVSNVNGDIIFSYSNGERHGLVRSAIVADVAALPLLGFLLNDSMFPPLFVPP